MDQLLVALDVECAADAERLTEQFHGLIASVGAEAQHSGHRDL